MINIITIDIQSKKYGDKEILKNLKEKIKDNELVSILGPSGCGKTTLLNMIGAIDNDYNGTIMYDDVNIKNVKDKDKFIRENINYLFQNYALIENESVLKNLLLALEYEKLKKDEKIKKIQNALKMVGLSGYEKKIIYTLSGGEQQRIALARVMLKRGNIILADEPTGNLDNDNKELVFSILKNMKEKGKTIIMVTHDKSLTKDCDRTIILKKI